MNELINICYETEQPTVSGRELHAALEVQSRYEISIPKQISKCTTVQG